MEQDEQKVTPFQTSKHGFEIFCDLMGKDITPLPTWQKGKLVLWYGDEWVQYDEFTDDPGQYGYSRYPAGAYMQTIALNPSVITEPRRIMDAALRINQCFDDEAFIADMTFGLHTPVIVDHFGEDASEILFMAGEMGRAGHWQSIYDEVSDTHQPMRPCLLGAAIARCANSEEWLDELRLEASARYATLCC